jgi:hypothetical protein
MPYFDTCPPEEDSLFLVRPARNALKLVRIKFYHLIYKSMVTPTKRTMHGRRVFDIYPPPVDSLFQSFFLDLTDHSAASGGADT